MTAESPSPFLSSALGKIIGAVPKYVPEITHTSRIGDEGIIRVERPEDLQAAMADWKRINAGYSPRIHEDGEDPCLATWSRWNTCE